MPFPLAKRNALRENAQSSTKGKFCSSGGSATIRISHAAADTKITAVNGGYFMKRFIAETSKQNGSDCITLARRADRRPSQNRDSLAVTEFV